ncbi:ATPase [Chitinophaga caeni]|uniref:ATPase n=1 Tax=Chitinophaga caeni TaxID=2029983 RepID=A0A291QY12_9BACT|nr:SRPBCC domain-containing protein [Chitinophaga caeni]ATL48753.1 ATPase [Chitinophaga caeni]
MEPKTKVNAEDGKQDLRITREFELPVELLFKAYVEPQIVEQWMGTKVIKLESKKHGGWKFQTSDQEGNVLFQANGVIHEFIPDEKITRTFEMEGAPFEVQLEYLEFTKISDDRSKLDMQIIYRSNDIRDQMLKVGVGMAKGINMAHNRLEEIVSKLK